MRLTRRNALIGLGTVAAGAGVIGGTGAFTSVDANRTVSISTEGDGSANVRIRVDPQDKHGDGLSDSGSNTVQLNLENLNQNATTKFDDALGVAPSTGSAGPYDVTADIVDGNGNGLDMASVSVDNGNGITTGSEAGIDVEINLRDYTTTDFPDNTNIVISVSQSN